VEENLTLAFGEEEARIPLECEVVLLAGNVSFLLLHFGWAPTLADWDLFFGSG
jgi:hypothetical protein